MLIDTIIPPTRDWKHSQATASTATENRSNNPSYYSLISEIRSGKHWTHPSSVYAHFILSYYWHVQNGVLWSFSTFDYGLSSCTHLLSICVIPLLWKFAFSVQYLCSISDDLVRPIIFADVFHHELVPTFFFLAPIFRFALPLACWVFWPCPWGLFRAVSIGSLIPVLHFVCFILWVTCLDPGYHRVQCWGADFSLSSCHRTSCSSPWCWASGNLYVPSLGLYHSGVFT